jgi:hypothetical protein
MPRKPDILGTASDEERLGIMRDACRVVFGEAVGAKVWKAMEPSLLYRERQLGDCVADPSQNYWKGVWRIHEAE